MERRRTRGLVTRDVVGRYLDRYVDFIRNIDMTVRTPVPAEDRGPYIFSIWFQGEENAPDLVKACWASVRANCPQKLVVLDADNIFEWIELPEYVVSKWREGLLRPAHFADICRLALLERYGGLWLDATDYVPAPLPAWLWEEDFFLYMSGENIRGWYSYVQNCFIRAGKGNPLVSAWLKLILEYWHREDRPVDYFVHQLLLKKLVENNEAAAREFAGMPKIVQDPTHRIWFTHGNDDYDEISWKEMTSSALFQKTEFKSKMARSPREGSNAAHLIESYCK